MPRRYSISRAKPESDDSGEWDVDVLTDEEGGFVGFLITPEGDGDPMVVLPTHDETETK